MMALRRHDSQVWAIDCEFTAPPGERPAPLCLVGRELLSGRLIRCWLADGAPVSPLFPLTADTLYIAYDASAELGCFLALGWPFPVRVVDLFAEFRCLTSGLSVPCGHGLLGALAYGIFIPTGQRPIDPQTRRGAALLRTAKERGIDPYALARIADQLWQEDYALYAETIMARREARQTTGLSHTRIDRWEGAGHDYSSWPGLDDTAHELAGRLPALGRGLGTQYDGESDEMDYAGRLWDLLRDSDDRLPARHDPAILRRAVDRLDEDPEAGLDDGPLTFSGQRFELYLARHGIPWPRLDSGALALDDDTFREMAKAYPAAIGPLREVRQALSQLKLHALAVGSDGRNRCLLSAFGSRTGRNQPRNSADIFGPSCWLRSLMQPGPGRALASVDWSQQALAIAAALSGDPAMQAAYQSGDFSLTVAKMAGAVPPEATKATHGAIREQCKTVALGVLYGLSERG